MLYNYKVKVKIMKNLLEKLLMPIVKCLKRPHDINIIHQDTAIRPSIECNSKTLKSFLASSIP